MSLHRRLALRERLRPWHGLMFAAFLAGTARTLSTLTEPISPSAVALAAFNGLLWVLGFQLTVGMLWAYAVEYYNAGGKWTDLPFLVPFAVAVAVGVAVGVVFENAGGAVWAAFWTFVVVAGLTAVVVWVRVGYRESAA
ncbi:hypothetical protein [Halopelagius longus]|uniref:Uncharacterized protein n=1 Tax=Halopelagius longus TaxID=1236180 RepID=A0A1H0YKH0_9EURY|nr:hypothetical protein [Halopelagius longus]RDI72536.1 hypothetical protein DWB78_12870 [Halopelagius longus]SDQ15662.1 hypothetical protein SAMN05216278_0691 [Halopelagius longus]